VAVIKRVPAAEPLVEGSGGEAPAKLKSFSLDFYGILTSKE